jgi:hypothetical protein
MRLPGTIPSMEGIRWGSPRERIWRISGGRFTKSVAAPTLLDLETLELSVFSGSWAAVANP